jgi:hypothetical protein
MTRTTRWVTRAILHPHALDPLPQLELLGSVLDEVDKAVDFRKNDIVGIDRTHFRLKPIDGADSGIPLLVILDPGLPPVTKSDHDTLFQLIRLDHNVTVPPESKD